MNMCNISNVDFAYTSDIPVLHNCSFACARGTCTGVLGANGSGKSTLLKLLAGLLTVQNGSIVHELPTPHAQHMAYVPQDTALPVAMTVRDLVNLGRLPHQHGFGWETQRDRDAVTQALKRMQCTDLQYRDITTLSGGERQRAIIARALAQEPQLLVLDEPVAHLDIAQQLHVMRLLRTLCDAGTTLVVALHDLHLAQHYCDHVLLLHNGSTVDFGAPRDVLTPQTLAQTFGVAMHWGTALIPA